MAAERGAFIDQSQSLNIHMDQPNFGKLTSLHFYTWSKVQPFDIITYKQYFVNLYLSRLQLVLMNSSNLIKILTFTIYFIQLQFNLMLIF
jgi:hypothetical protein